METVQKIFHDNEEVFSPDILKQIESVFENKRDSDRGFSYVCESKMEYGISKKSRECTLEDYYQLPDERRAELIDGVCAYNYSSEDQLGNQCTASCFHQPKEGSMHGFFCTGRCTA